MIVQVEGGRTNPSIGTICQLAEALGAPVPALLEMADDRRIRVVRADETVSLWTDKSGSFAHLLGGTVSRERLELWDWRLAPRATYAAPAHPAGTRELLWVRRGRVRLTTHDEVTEAKAGDLIVFEADAGHEYSNPGKSDCTFSMIVQLPPNVARSARGRP
jgi:quercetin dioxygenase-like cupin family protein